MSSTTLPAVRVHEVAPRDGLQNEQAILSLADKREFISILDRSGVDSIEVGSFVRKDMIPQLADTDELVEGLKLRAESYALLANRRGMERFKKSNLDGVTVIVSATDEHSQKNVGQNRERALTHVGELIREAVSLGKHVRAYVGMAFVCPFTGAVNPQQASEVIRSFADAGAGLVVLADTLGHATPAQVESLIELAQNNHPELRLGLHMHDTMGRAVENCHRAYELGIRDFDSAVGGVGGCPFAPGAAGNLDTLALVRMLNEIGATHSLHLEVLQQAADFLRSRLSATI